MTVFWRRNNISLSMLNQRRNLTLKQCWLWIDTKKVSLLCYHAQEFIIFILTLKRSDFQRRSIIILWTLKQRQNLMSQQLLIGLILKPILFLCYTTRLTTSSQCRNYVDRSILTDFHVILTYFVDVISTGEWSTPFWRTFPI